MVTPDALFTLFGTSAQNKKYQKNQKKKYQNRIYLQTYNYYIYIY